MGYLNLLLETTAPSCASVTNLAAETDCVGVKIRFDSGLITYLSAGQSGKLVTVRDATTNVKFTLDSNVDGAGTGVTFAMSFPSPVSDGIQTGVIPLASFAAATDYILMVWVDNNSHGGVYGKIKVMDTSGTIVHANATATLSYGIGAFATGRGVVSINEPVGSDRTAGKIDGVAVYIGTTSWPTGADEYDVPLAGDTGLAAGWLFDETSGGTAASLLGGGNSLTIPGVENTNYAWAAGGGWDAAAAGSTANVFTGKFGSLLRGKL